MGDSLVKRVCHSACAGGVGAVAGGLLGALIPIIFHGSSSPHPYSNNLVPYCAASGAAVGGAAFFIGEFFYYKHSPKKRED